MSLNYELKGVPAWERLEDGEKFPPMLDGFIWATISVGLDHIAKNNVDEWRWRLAYLAEIDSSVFFKRDEESGKPVPYIPSEEEFEDFIGIKTNVTRETRQQFMKRYDGVLARRAQDRLKQLDRRGV